VVVDGGSVWQLKWGGSARLYTPTTEGVVPDFGFADLRNHGGCHFRVELLS